MSVATSTYKQALEILAKVSGFSTNAQIIFDPSAPAPADLVGKFDTVAGFTVYPVHASTPPEETGAYMVYGYTPQTSLGIPPPVFVKGSRKTYLLDSEAVCVFSENVADLLAQHKLLKEKAAAGHPLGNRGIRYGDNLMPFADDLNPVAVLIWSSSSNPYAQEQS